MNLVDLLDVGLELQDFCQKQNWQSCFIGGIAVQRWGQVRLTRDVDLTLLTGFGNEASFVEALLARYTAPIPDAIDIRDAEGIAVRHDKTLDWGYVEEQLIPLAEAKDDPGILKEFARIRGLAASL